MNPQWHGDDYDAALARARRLNGSVVWSWNVVAGTRTWGWWSDPNARPHLREGERIAWTPVLEG